MYKFSQRPLTDHKATGTKELSPTVAVIRCTWCCYCSLEMLMLKIKGNVDVYVEVAVNDDMLKVTILVFEIQNNSK